MRGAASLSPLVGLNDETTCVASRLQFVKLYCEGVSLSYLRTQAPFIAMELERQGLVDLGVIRAVMSYPFP
jgi:hypothetical protein